MEVVAKRFGGLDRSNQDDGWLKYRDRGVEAGVADVDGAVASAEPRRQVTMMKNQEAAWLFQCRSRTCHARDRKRSPDSVTPY